MLPKIIRATSLPESLSHHVPFADFSRCRKCTCEGARRWRHRGPRTVLRLSPRTPQTHDRLRPFGGYCLFNDIEGSNRCAFWLLRTNHVFLLFFFAQFTETGLNLVLFVFSGRRRRGTTTAERQAPATIVLEAYSFVLDNAPLLSDDVDISKVTGTATRVATSWETWRLYIRRATHATNGIFTFIPLLRAVASWPHRARRSLSRVSRLPLLLLAPVATGAGTSNSCHFSACCAINPTLD